MLVLLDHIARHEPMLDPAKPATNHRRTSRRSGVAAVEFAVILPFVMVLFLGIIEFGRMLMVQQIITNAAREGCRYAVLPGSTVSGSRSVVTNYLTNAGITLSDPTNQVTVSPDPSTAAQGTSITVTVTVPCNSVSWLPSPIFMGGKQLGSTVVMRLESNNT
jgi:Flp pilus assembly protein TadG